MNGFKKVVLLLKVIVCLLTQRRLGIERKHLDLMNVKTWKSDLEEIILLVFPTINPNPKLSIGGVNRKIYIGGNFISSYVIRIFHIL